MSCLWASCLQMCRSEMQQARYHLQAERSLFLYIRFQLEIGGMNTFILWALFHGKIMVQVFSSGTLLPPPETTFQISPFQSSNPIGIGRLILTLQSVISIYQTSHRLCVHSTGPCAGCNHVDSRVARWGNLAPLQSLLRDWIRISNEVPTTA